jgi:uncharacterized protein YjbJ (UPF0337 family)
MIGARRTRSEVKCRLNRQGENMSQRSPLSFGSVSGPNRLPLHAARCQAPPIAAFTVLAEASGLAEAIKGVVEDVKGKAKEVIGTVTGRNDLINEGKAQQDKAEARRDATAKEAKAEKARAKAKLQEACQKAEQ